MITSCASVHYFQIARQPARNSSVHQFVKRVVVDRERFEGFHATRAGHIVQNVHSIYLTALPRDPPRSRSGRMTRSLSCLPKVYFHRLESMSQLMCRCVKLASHATHWHAQVYPQRGSASVSGRRTAANRLRRFPAVRKGLRQVTLVLAHREQWGLGWQHEQHAQSYLALFVSAFNQIIQR